jgi:hypothetical protein
MRKHSALFVIAVVSFAGGLLSNKTMLALFGQAQPAELLVGKPPVPRW